VVVDVADLLVVVLALLYPLVPEPRRENFFSQAHLHLKSLNHCGCSSVVEREKMNENKLKDPEFASVE
jgi:hypothetical protein